MQLNKSTDYAIKILLFLKETNNLKYQTEIANATDIPPKYLATILSKLKKAGYIESLRGNKGGYYLKKELSEITVYDIICITESSSTISCCLEQKKTDGLYRNIKNYYYEVQNKLEHNIFAVTLQDILNYY